MWIKVEDREAFARASLAADTLLLPSDIPSGCGKFGQTSMKKRRRNECRLVAKVADGTKFPAGRRRINSALFRRERSRKLRATQQAHRRRGTVSAAGEAPRNRNLALRRALRS